MPALEDEETFTVHPRQVPVREAGARTWSVYVMRCDLTARQQAPALKIGMVGTGTIANRLREHGVKFGASELVDVWTLEHGVHHLEAIHAWRLTEQYEARLQFAPEFVDPTARLRRLRPTDLAYSYEWFEDDQRVIDAINMFAAKPVTLPHGWTLATGVEVPRPLEP